MQVCVCRIRAPSPASGRISTSNSSLCFVMEMCGSWSSSMLPATHNARDQAITSLAVEYPKVCQYIGVHAALCVRPCGHTSTHPCIDASLHASTYTQVLVRPSARILQTHTLASTNRCQRPRESLKSTPAWKGVREVFFQRTQTAISVAGLVLCVEEACRSRHPIRSRIHLK